MDPVVCCVFVVCLFVCLILLSLNLQIKTRRAREIERERERERDPGSQRKPRTPADTSEPAITNVKGPLGRTACGGRTGNMVIGRGLSPYTVEMGVPGFNIIFKIRSWIGFGEVWTRKLAQTLSKTSLGGTRDRF